jgi:hypothetical protein
MRQACLVIGTAILSVSACLGADQSWSGKLSDSMCGAQHKATAEHSASNLSDAGCIALCVKNGAKYVFVSGGKVYKIHNQDFADLKPRAGQTVRVTGEMTGDAIKVSRISNAPPEHRGEKSSL